MPDTSSQRRQPRHDWRPFGGGKAGKAYPIRLTMQLLHMLICQHGHWVVDPRKVAKASIHGLYLLVAHPGAAPFTVRSPVLRLILYVENILTSCILGHVADGQH